MNCDKCHKDIGTKAFPAYQVEMGYADEETNEFHPDEYIGHYCSDCLKQGVYV